MIKFCLIFKRGDLVFMKLHPAVSITLGLVVFMILEFIGILWRNIDSNAGFIIYILSFIISGFLTMYFTTEKKIRYVFYVLVPVIIFLFIINQVFSSLTALIFIPIGGLLGKITYKDIRDIRFNTRAIIIGIIATFIIYFLVAYSIIYLVH